MAPKAMAMKKVSGRHKSGVKRKGGSHKPGKRSRQGEGRRRSVRF